MPTVYPFVRTNRSPQPSHYTDYPTLPIIMKLLPLILGTICLVISSVEGGRWAVFYGSKCDTHFGGHEDIS